MPFAPKSRCYSYLRFSRPEQLRGDSLRRQTAQAEKFAVKHDLIIDRTLTLTDLGVSAYRGANADKGALQGFLVAIDQGKVPPGSILLVESLDRLSRQSAWATIPIFQQIISAGVSIVTLSDEKIYDQTSMQDSLNLVMMVLIATRAHEESEIKSQRLKEVWINKRDKKTVMTGRVPAWIKKEGEKLEVIEENAKIIKQIFDWAADGYGQSKIVKMLTEKQMPPIGRAEKWHNSYIAKILANRSVLGEFQPHTIATGKREPIGNPIKNYFPAIVSENVFYKVQKNRVARQCGGGRGRTGKNGFVNIFKGILKHDSGCNFQINNKGKKSTGRKLVPSDCMTGKIAWAAIDYRKFELCIMSLISGMDWSQYWKNENTTNNQNREKINDITTEIEKIDQKIKKMDEKFIDSVSVSYIELRDKMLAQKSKLNEELESIKIPQTEHDSIKNFSQMNFEKMDAEELFKFKTKVALELSELLDKIVVTLEATEKYMATLYYRDGTEQYLVYDHKPIYME